MTTKHTHTQGPWTIEAPSKGCAFPIIHGGAEYSEIAIVYSGDADKHLITAAPDLLGAVCQLRDYLQTLAGEVQIPPSLYLQGKRAMDAAESAINKAEGGGEP